MELHRLHIVHRDLKPENILILDGIIKISDFGFSKILDKKDDQLLYSYLGTPLYCSPQILMNQPYTSKTDVWSLGVILYEILIGELAFKGKDCNQLLKEMKLKCYKTNIEIQTLYPYKRFIQKML